MRDLAAASAWLSSRSDRKIQFATCDNGVCCCEVFNRPITTRKGIGVIDCYKSIPQGLRAQCYPQYVSSLSIWISNPLVESQEPIDFASRIVRQFVNEVKAIREAMMVWDDKRAEILPWRPKIGSCCWKVFKKG